MRRSSREFREELDVTLTNGSCLGTYEGVFTYDGETGHEIWRVYEAAIEGNWPYERDRFEGREPELGETDEATWMAPDRLREGVTFYDPAILNDLTTSAEGDE